MLQRFRRPLAANDEAPANAAVSASTAILDSAQPPPPPPPPPQANKDDLEDGGWVGWMQVAAAFALYFNHLGLLNSFGVFQTYYAQHLLRDSSPSAISWIGSIQVFCLMAVGVVIGPLYDAGHCRALVAAGTALVFAGFMLTSVSSRYWQVLLAQGVCTGLGTCCLAIPSIAVVPAYFRRRRRATAMAAATVGSGLGATLYPLIFERARPRVGFGWAVRIMGFVALAWCLFALAIIKPRGARPGGASKKKKTASPLSWRFYVDTSAFAERPYVLYCVAIFFNNLVFFNPAYYLQSYALAHGMASSPVTGYLISILNAATIPGRILPSLIADRVGPLDTYAVVCAFASASIFYWTSVTNAAGNVAFAVLYGFFSGGVVSLAQVVVAAITPDLGTLGTRLGMVSVIKGVGSLVGPPISGAIVAATGGRYLGVQLFAAFGIMVTAVVSVAMRVDVARMEMRAQDGIADAANEIALETGVLRSETRAEVDDVNKTVR